MSGMLHASCGYSEFAPGCDDWECLVHRLDVAFARGWDSSSLQARLDASLADAVAEVLPSLQNERAVELSDHGNR